MVLRGAVRKEINYEKRKGFINKVVREKYSQLHETQAKC